MNVLISTKPFIICLEAVLVGVTVRTAVSLSAAIPLGTSTKRADFLKEQKSRSVHVFLKTPFPAVSSWLRSFPILRRQPRSLSSVSGHPARWSCVRGWFMRSFWACNHGSAAIAPLSPHGDGGAPSVTTRLASLPRAENHRLVLWAIWGLQWELFRRASPHGPFTPPAAAVLCGSPVILLCRLTACPAFHSARR